MAAAPQSSALAPMPTEYGGDEVSALVLDPGYSCVRAGFAGEDIPKSVIPSYYGIIPSAFSDDDLIFGDNAIHNPLPGISTENPMAKDGTVDDWDTVTKLWEYAITSRLTNYKLANQNSNGYHDADVDMETDVAEAEKPLEDHPLLMTEPAWNSAKSREKSIQMAMEDWGCPAFWLARSGVLAAYAGGKATALVIDVGASTVSVTPVHDGVILKKGVQKSPLAGNFVSQQVRLMFANAEPRVPLSAHYQVESKSPVDAGLPPNVVYRKFKKPPAESFKWFQEERVLKEFKESIVAIWPGPGRLSGGNGVTSNMETARALPGRTFEMPDGWNQMFTGERYRPAEGLFDSKMALTGPSNPAPSPTHTIPYLVTSSLAAVDVDIRPHLLNNIVVTGGSSLIHGFTDRLNLELSHAFPGPRVRLTAAGNPAERRFAGWLGGSIVASLGTFHQMWISKKEYEEHGPVIVEKRCWDAPRQIP